MIQFKQGSRYKVYFKFNGIKQVYSHIVIADNCLIARHITLNKGSNKGKIYPITILRVEAQQ